MVAHAVIFFATLSMAVIVAVSHPHPLEYYAKPKYHFKYGVDDPKHGDHHSQWEERDGDKVRGGYTIKESDGTWRHVSYTSDKDTGFNAVVERHGKAIHPQGELGEEYEDQVDEVDKANHTGYSVFENPEVDMQEVGHEVVEQDPDAAYGYVR